MSEQQQQNSGQPTDYKYRNGPVVERSCTDLFCLFLFIAFTIGLFVIAGYAFKNGDPHRIAQPYDPDHRACGVDEGVQDYPYIYFANPTTSKYLYVTVCVKSCPLEQAEQSTQSSARHLEAKKLDCATNSIVKSCEQNLTPSNQEEMLVVYDTQLFMNTVCLPTTKKYYEQVKDKIDVETMEKISNDMITSKWIIFASIFTALIISFIFLFLIEKLAGCVIWTLIIMLLLLFVAGGIMSIGYYYALTDPSKLPASAKSQINPEALQEDAKANNTSPNNYLVLSIILFSLAGLELLLIICFYNRINLAIAVLETACDFVQDNFTVVVLPVVTFLIMLIYFIWWFAVGVYLFSCGEVTHKPHQLPFGQFTFTQNEKIFGYIHAFALLWNFAFIVASVEFIICGAVTIWYFQQGPRGQAGPSPLGTAIGRYFKYHLGTVAIGSLLIAIIQAIRIMLAYLYHNQEALCKKNKFFEYLFKCLQCCMWCFEKCVQFINKNAYTICNMTGQNFFSSAKDAVFLILRNPARYAAVGGFGEVFNAIGKMFIAVLTGLFTYVILTKTEKFKNDVIFPQGPALLCGCIGYVVGSLFMSVYGIACDAILVVFIMDEEMEKHNGKGIAISCPPRLEKFLEDQ